MRTIKRNTKILLDGLVMLGRKRVEDIEGITEQMVEVVAIDTAMLSAERKDIIGDLTDVLYGSTEIADALGRYKIGVEDPDAAQ